MLERDGQFTWEEDGLFDGIRQDASESVRRYRVVRNAHLFNQGALTKRKGLYQLSSATIGSSTLDTVAGYDCHFTNGTQKLVVVQEGASNADAYVYNTATRDWTAQSVSIANGKRVDMVMFADELHTMDGGTLRKMNASTTWATPGESTYSNPSNFGTVYANRLVLSGNGTYPHQFFPSGIRDSGTWDAALAVTVTGVQGETVTCLGAMGPFLIVGGKSFTRAYYLGTASPFAWDYDDISTLIGPQAHQSFVTVPAAQGKAGRNAAFFWSTEGPMMLYHHGQGLPSLYNLTPPIHRAIKGIDHQGMPPLAVDRYADITAAYVPELDQIRFSVVSKSNFVTNGTNSLSELVMSVSLASCLAFAEGDGYPFWSYQDNANADLPVSTLFTAQVHPDTHLPSTDGIIRCLCARGGHIYEMDALATHKDTIEGAEYPIDFYVWRDGYDGVEDGTRNHTKSLRGVFARTTLTGEHELFFKAVADGGVRDSTATFDLSGSLTTWGNGEAWANGSNWNAGDFVNARGRLGVLGKKFDLQVFDDGNIEGDFQINGWSLIGYMEDRR